jgi:hypothetical protein
MGGLNCKKFIGFSVTGKSFSEALILASTNPQHDKRLFIDLPVQYMKTTSSEHVVFINSLLPSYSLRLHNLTQILIFRQSANFQEGYSGFTFNISEYQKIQRSTEFVVEKKHYEI